MPSTTTPTTTPEMPDPSRAWKCVFVNPKSVNPSNAAFQICLTSRTDGAAVNYVHDTLYGSIRYGVSQQVMLPELTDTNIIMMRIQILDAVKGTEIKGKKEKLKGKRILDGLTEDSMQLSDTNGGGSWSNTSAADGNAGDSSNSGDSSTATTSSTRCFAINSKIKFLDVSSNYDGSPFRFQISYYDPRMLDQPIMVVQSAPFKVYARRKRKRGSSSSSSASTKRKSVSHNKKKVSQKSNREQPPAAENVELYLPESEYSTSSMVPFESSCSGNGGSIHFQEPPKKRQKPLSSEEMLQLYFSEFDELMNLTRKMSKKERKKAVGAALQQLVGDGNVGVGGSAGENAAAPKSAPAPASTNSFMPSMPHMFEQQKSTTTMHHQQQPQKQFHPSMMDVVHNPPTGTPSSTTFSLAAAHSSKDRNSPLLNSAQVTPSFDDPFMSSSSYHNQTNGEHENGLLFGFE